MVLGIILVFVAFLLALLDKTKKFEESSKNWKRTHISLMIFILVIGVIQIVSDNCQKKKDYKELNQRYTQDTLDHHKNWKRDSLAFISLADSAKSILNDTKRVMENLIAVSKNQESQFYPLRPMDIFVSYYQIVDRKKFDLLCPYFCKDSLRRMTKNGYTFNSATRDTMASIEASQLVKADKASRDFLAPDGISIQFKRNRNLLAGGTYANMVWIDLYNTGQNAQSYQIGYNGNRIIIYKAILFKKVPVQGDVKSEIKGIRELLGWRLSCQVTTSNADSVRGGLFEIFTGTDNHREIDLQIDHWKNIYPGNFSFDKDLKKVDFPKDYNGP